VSRVRLIRVLIYDGTAEWVRDCARTRTVKEQFTCPNGTIREAKVQDFLQERVFFMSPEETKL
jgi:hypothetical protein